VHWRGDMRGRCEVLPESPGHESSREEQTHALVAIALLIFILHNNCAHHIGMVYLLFSQFARHLTLSKTTDYNW
jgi:hypothetical protein